MTQSVNPLKSFFRQPAIYIRLPSNGQFWSEGSIEIPQNQELPVLPMTAVDEITYRTPDALFNGQAVVNVVQSCVPAVKNAWAMPATDLNSVLIAIRIASYGHEMSVTSTCPKCTTASDYELDLRVLLDSIGRPDFNSSLRCGSLELMFQPINYEFLTKNSLEQYNFQRQIQNITDSDQPEEQKLRDMANVMAAITLLTVRTVAQNIQAIRTPEHLVTDSQHITEFLNQCDRATFETIKNHVIELRAQSESRPMLLTCDSCKTQYEQPISLEMSSFFARAS